MITDAQHSVFDRDPLIKVCFPRWPLKQLINSFDSQQDINVRWIALKFKVEVHYIYLIYIYKLIFWERLILADVGMQKNCI